MKSISLNTILLIAVAILGTLYLNSYFGCNKDNSYKIKLEYKDSMFAMKQREINGKDIELAKKDSIILVRTSLIDSVLSNIEKHQAVYKPIYENLKNIPVRIDAIRSDDAAIKRAFSRREEN